MTEQFNHHQLTSPGITLATLPSELYSKVMEEIVEIQNNFQISEKYNHALAGNIENQYYLNKSFSIMEPFLTKMANEYTRKWNYYPREDDYKLQSLWANFQRKHEFNPIHSHNSVMSFVCWMSIPYSIQDELNLEAVKNSRAKAASIFQFVYTDIIGRICHEDFFVDKDWSGRVIMFPAALHHQVYPFYTSDGFRISISGNLA